MALRKKPHYDLGELQTLLREGITPTNLGNHIDEIMNDLVCYAGSDDDYPGRELSSRYSILKVLRDFFWKLEEKKKY